MRVRPCFSLVLTTLSLWALCSIASAAYRTEYVVAKDGSGDFERIQDAIDDCKSFPDLPVTIRIQEGEYWGKVVVPSWNTNLNLIGEGEVTLIGDLHFKSVDRGRNSTFMTATLEVWADDFTARNLRIVNAAGPIGQAIALQVEGDRCAFYDCRIEGNQDTLYLAGENNRHYFLNCSVSGTTDYIFGGATAFFRDCTLHSKGNSYLTAASTPQGVRHGLVFVNCDLTAEPEVDKLFLGRPWRRFAKTVFIDCSYGDFVADEGWGDWGLSAPGETVFYAESASSVPDSMRERRVSWSHLLNETESRIFSESEVFGDWIPVSK